MGERGANLQSRPGGYPPSGWPRPRQAGPDEFAITATTPPSASACLPASASACGRRLLRQGHGPGADCPPAGRPWPPERSAGPPQYPPSRPWLCRAPSTPAGPQAGCVARQNRLAVSLCSYLRLFAALRTPAFSSFQQFSAAAYAKSTTYGASATRARRKYAISLTSQTAREFSNDGIRKINYLQRTCAVSARFL